MAENSILSSFVVYFTQPHYMQLTSKKVHEWWLGMGLKGRSHDLIKLLSWNLPQGTDRNHKKAQSG
jgi:hypothetical protein